jgi:hypothetical protein
MRSGEDAHQPFLQAINLDDDSKASCETWAGETGVMDVSLLVGQNIVPDA